MCRPHFNDVLPPRFHMILALNLDVQESHLQSEEGFAADSLLAGHVVSSLANKSAAKDFEHQQIVYYCLLVSTEWAKHACDLDIRSILH